jgi:kynureninase
VAQGYVPGAGISNMLSGTPPVLGLTATSVGIELTIAAGIANIRAKAAAITGYAIELIDDELTTLGCAVGSPRNPNQRGSHVALVHENARALSRELRNEGVVVDFRTPDVIRLGLSPLTTRYADVYDGLQRIKQLLS